MSTTIKNVTVAGSGVLGYQIAFQTAFFGFNVMIYDISDEILEKAKTKFDGLAESYKKDLQATDAQIVATNKNMHYSSDLSKSVENADLVIEAVPENIQIKTEFYQKLAKVAPAKTIFASNSSTLLPSQFAEVTGRPSKFLNLHFANQIWLRNTAEIMGHPGTDKAIVTEIFEFSKAIGMVPIVVKKELPGYILNSLLNPFLNAGLRLWLDGFATPETIDKTWMLGTGSPYGPMAFYDIVGITTPYNIYKLQVEKGKTEDQDVVDRLKKDFIEPNKLGVSTGEGFYKYPNPAYAAKDFLLPSKADLSKVNIKKVVVAGSGVLGYQIAVQVAYSGFETVVYDINQEALEKAKNQFESLAESYQKYLKADAKKIEETKANLTYSTDLKSALVKADLVIEAVPENLKIKENFWKQASQFAPKETIFASNSSTLLPSELSPFTDRPKQFLNLHFANHIMVRNTAEIMGSPETDESIFQEIVEFAKAIHMLPIELKKEKSGYVLDSLLIPLLVAGLTLWAFDFADAETIDKTWMIATGSSFGPMGILDKNGMNTNYNVLINLPGERIKIIAEKLKTEFIDKNKLGESTGEGFYKYPNPAYLDKNFLKS